MAVSRACRVVADGFSSQLRPLHSQLSPSFPPSLLPSLSPLAFSPLLAIVKDFKIDAGFRRLDDVNSDDWIRWRTCGGRWRTSVGLLIVCNCFSADSGARTASSARAEETSLANDEMARLVRSFS